LIIRIADDRKTVAGTGFESPLKRDHTDGVAYEPYGLLSEKRTTKKSLWLGLIHRLQNSADYPSLLAFLRKSASSADKKNVFDQASRHPRFARNLASYKTFRALSAEIHHPGKEIRECQ